MVDDTQHGRASATRVVAIAVVIGALDIVF